MRASYVYPPSCTCSCCTDTWTRGLSGSPELIKTSFYDRWQRVSLRSIKRDTVPVGRVLRTYGRIVCGWRKFESLGSAGILINETTVVSDGVQYLSSLRLIGCLHLFDGVIYIRSEKSGLDNDLSSSRNLRGDMLTAEGKHHRR